MSEIFQPMNKKTLINITKRGSSDDFYHEQSIAIFFTNTECCYYAGVYSTTSRCKKR